MISNDQASEYHVILHPTTLHPTTICLINTIRPTDNTRESAKIILFININLSFAANNNFLGRLTVNGRLDSIPTWQKKNRQTAYVQLESVVKTIQLESLHFLLESCQDRIHSAISGLSLGPVQFEDSRTVYLSTLYTSCIKTVNFQSNDLFFQPGPFTLYVTIYAYSLNLNGSFQTYKNLSNFDGNFPRMLAKNIWQFLWAKQWHC